VPFALGEKLYKASKKILFSGKLRENMFKEESLMNSNTFKG